jgi:hypothetical protein
MYVCMYGVVPLCEDWSNLVIYTCILCVYIHVCVCVSMHTCMYVCMVSCLCVKTGLTVPDNWVCMRACMHACVHVCASCMV